MESNYRDGPTGHKKHALLPAAKQKGECLKVKNQ